MRETPCEGEGTYRPSFLMYKSQPDVDQIIMRNAKGEPEYDFVDESGVRHVVWL